MLISRETFEKKIEMFSKEVPISVVIKGYNKQICILNDFSF